MPSGGSKESLGSLQVGHSPVGAGSGAGFGAFFAASFASAPALLAAMRASVALLFWVLVLALVLALVLVLVLVLSSLHALQVQQPCWLRCELASPGHAQLLASSCRLTK